MKIATNGDSQITINIEDLKAIINKTVEEKLAEDKEHQGPVGTVISYMGNTAPNGYLKCDGTVYNIVDYPNLSKQIQEQFGTYNYFGGDGKTTFAVPDLRGEFLRGTGTGARNTGTGVAVGKHQEATTHLDLQISSTTGRIGISKTKGPGTGEIASNKDTTCARAGYVYSNDFGYEELERDWRNIYFKTN